MIFECRVVVAKMRRLGVTRAAVEQKQYRIRRISPANQNKLGQPAKRHVREFSNAPGKYVPTRIQKRSGRSRTQYPQDDERHSNDREQSANHRKSDIPYSPTPDL
jgi:hypothetical protein